MTDLRRLLALVAPTWPWLAAGTLFAIVAVAANVGLLGLSAYLISKAAIASGVAEIALAVTGVRVLAISRAAFRYLERYVTHRATFRVLAVLRVWFFGAIEPLAPMRLIRERSGDVLTRVVADVDALEDFIIRVLVPPVVAAVVTVSMALLYGFFDIALGVVILTFLVIVGVVLPLLTRWLSRRPAAALATLRGDVGALAVDGVRGMADLVVLDGAAAHRQRLLEHAGRLDGARRRLSVLEATSTAVAALCASLAGLAILVLAIPMVSAGRLEGVFLAALPLAAIAAFEAVQPLSRSFQLVDVSLASARRLFELVDAPPPVTDPPVTDPPVTDSPSVADPPLLAYPPSAADPRVQPDRPASSLEPGPHDLEVTGLSFRYADDEPWVLREIDLRLGPGERVAIVGPSGSGKSTLVGLLSRFWDYEQGSIRIGGRELHELDQDVTRSLLSVVPQDVHLFNASIEDNLAVADADADGEAMAAACRIAQLDGFINGLPDGYDTRVGEDGLLMSGGERRRLAIARAVLKDAPIVILDEATADLDGTTESDLWKSLEPWLAGKVTLVISHRPTVVAHVDRVLRLAGPDDE